MSDTTRLDRIEKTLEEISLAQKKFAENQVKFEQNQVKFEQNQLKFEQNQLARDKEIEKILSVQRDLQERQLNLTEAVTRLIESSQRFDQRINQLLGYSLSNESDHLDLNERLIKIEKRVEKLERQ